MANESAAPTGYHTVQPYLIFKNTRAAIDFYTRVFGATERMCMEREGRVQHAELLIGDSCVMMADENPAFRAFSPPHYGGSPISMMLYVADCDSTYTTAVAAGATSLSEPADQPHGARAAMVVDPFGYSWYVAQHLRDLSPAELEAMMKGS
ncbi:MAG TPA: VOC family protein [Acidobacteriaceae bacterium]